MYEGPGIPFWYRVRAFHKNLQDLNHAPVGCLVLFLYDIMLCYFLER